MTNDPNRPTHPVAAREPGPGPGDDTSHDRDARGRRAGWRPSAVTEVGEEPDYRFTLANERTFLAWIRTALALLAGGVAVIKLVPSFSLAGGRHLLGIPLVLLSLLLSLSAYRHWALGERAMRLNRPLPRSLLPPVLAGSLTLITVVALVLVLTGAGPR
jgi:putative membrane protein